VSSKKRDLTSDEKALWRRVARHVKTRKPLKDDDDAIEPSASRASLRQAKGNAPATPTARKTNITPSLSPSKRSSAVAARSPADRGGEKRVRRGKLEIGGKLDLHGYTLESGRAATVRFLKAAQRRGDRTVIVITGRGRLGEGVLKRAFPGWLEAAELKPILSGFAQAHQDHGGAGAFYVFLKRA
jgi:DNA-nicking Smr family endonuclease